MVKKTPPWTGLIDPSERILKKVTECSKIPLRSNLLDFPPFEIIMGVSISFSLQRGVIMALINELLKTGYAFKLVEPLVM